MNNSWTSDIQLSIQQSLLEIASQMGQPLDEVAAERLYRDSSILLDRIPCEPLTVFTLSRNITRISNAENGTRRSRLVQISSAAMFN